MLVAGKLVTVLSQSVDKDGLMDTADLLLDAAAAAALGFRLTWPGETAGASAILPKLHGWPVALSVPSEASAAPRLPSIKLTGHPLD